MITCELLLFSCGKSVGPWGIGETIRSKYKIYVRDGDDPGDVPKNGTRPECSNTVGLNAVLHPRRNS